MLAGETELHGGDLDGEGDAHRAPRPAPAAGSALSLREYVLSGATDLVALEEELRRLEAAMAGGAHDPATLVRYARAQARLGTRAATPGASGRRACGLGSTTPTDRPLLDTSRAAS